jgi:hypothetical protein
VQQAHTAAVSRKRGRPDGVDAARMRARRAKRRVNEPNPRLRRVKRRIAATARACRRAGLPVAQHTFEAMAAREFAVCKQQIATPRVCAACECELTAYEVHRRVRGQSDPLLAPLGGVVCPWAAPSGRQWVCPTCERALKKGDVPPLARANNFNLDGDPAAAAGLAELRALAGQMTPLEKAMVSPVVPMVQVWVDYGGQYKTRGNVIHFQNDVTHVVTLLPRPASEAGMLFVQAPAVGPASCQRRAATYASTACCSTARQWRTWATTPR